jgi:hypothetical protein
MSEASGGERGQLWTAIKSVGALAAFHFDKLPDDLETFVRGELGERGACA